MADDDGVSRTLSLRRHFTRVTDDEDTEDDEPGVGIVAALLEQCTGVR